MKFYTGPQTWADSTEGKRNACRVFVRKPEEKRPIERRITFKNNLQK
jgi:hypothetical protein